MTHDPAAAADPSSMPDATPSVTVLFAPEAGTAPHDPFPALRSAADTHQPATPVPASTGHNPFHQLLRGFTSVRSTPAGASGGALCGASPTDTNTKGKSPLSWIEDCGCTHRPKALQSRDPSREHVQVRTTGGAGSSTEPMDNSSAGTVRSG